MTTSSDGTPLLNGKCFHCNIRINLDRYDQHLIHCEGERPHMCTLKKLDEAGIECRKRFKTPASLKIHQGKHHTGKERNAKYNCSYVGCEFGTATEQLLQQHYERHRRGFRSRSRSRGRSVCREMPAEDENTTANAGMEEMSGPPVAILTSPSERTRSRTKEPSSTFDQNQRSIRSRSKQSSAIPEQTPHHFNILQQQQPIEWPTLPLMNTMSLDQQTPITFGHALLSSSHLDMDGQQEPDDRDQFEQPYGEQAEEVARLRAQLMEERQAAKEEQKKLMAAAASAFSAAAAAAIGPDGLYQLQLIDPDKAHQIMKTQNDSHDRIMMLLRIANKKVRAWCLKKGIPLQGKDIIEEHIQAYITKFGVRATLQQEFERDAGNGSDADDEDEPTDCEQPTDCEH